MYYLAEIETKICLIITYFRGKNCKNFGTLIGLRQLEALLPDTRVVTRTGWRRPIKYLPVHVVPTPTHYMNWQNI